MSTFTEYVIKSKIFFNKYAYYQQDRQRSHIGNEEDLNEGKGIMFLNTKIEALKFIDMNEDDDESNDGNDNSFTCMNVSKRSYRKKTLTTIPEFSLDS